MIIRKQFRILNRLYGISLMVKSRKFHGQTAYGFANKTVDDRYVVFLDYDDTFLYSSVLPSIELVQKKFKLSDFYVFRTNRGYHAICFDKVSISEYLAILNESFCCDDFRKAPLLFGHNRWTLRLTKKDGQKPKFIYRLKSKHNKYEKSSPHIRIIKTLHKIEINKKNSDKEKKIIGCKYPL